MEKVKIVIDNSVQMNGCPQGKLNSQHGTPGPNCQ